MKKVLIFSTAYFPFVGGAEVAVKEITDRIKDMQFDMITARMNGKLPKRERIGNVNVYRIGFGLAALDKFTLPFLGRFRAKRLHKANNYNLIWSIMASQAGIAAAFFKIKFPRVKLILTLQEGDEEEHLARYAFGSKFLYKLIIRPWHFFVFKKADIVTAISEHLKKRAIKNSVKAPIEVIPNGVDVLNCGQRIADRGLKELKEELGAKEGEKVLITTSRLVKKNAVDDVIKSLKYLPRSIKFLVLGIGPDLKMLQNLARKEGVEKRVVFLGHINNKEIYKYLKISDIFIRPSLSEGLGNSFLEAMAAGLPVIATPVGGIPDFLFDPKKNPDKAPTGLFCEVRGPKSIAEKVKFFFENKELTEKIKANARELVIKRYDWNIIAAKMKNIFNKL